MQKLLRNINTNAIFVWTPQLAERKDMVPHEPQAPARQENTNENPETAQPETAADLGIEAALATFKAEVRKPRKPKQPPGEA